MTELAGSGVPPHPEPADDPVDAEADLQPARQPARQPAQASLAPQPSVQTATPRPEIPPLDAGAIRAARALVRAEPRLGRLGETVVWAAGVQGECPPRPFACPVLLVVASSAASGRVEALQASPPDGVRLRVLAGHGADGPIGERDAATRDEATRAYALGRYAVDREVDGGADLLLVADVGAAVDTVATLAAVLTGAEPVACVPRGGDPAEWARTVATVRDARRRGLPLVGHPLGLLAAVGGTALATLTGMLVQASVRRTAVLLDGTAAAVCGLLAERTAESASIWWTAADRSADPAQQRAIDRLGIEPLLELGLGYDAGRGALLALPVLQTALALAAAATTQPG